MRPDGILDAARRVAACWIALCALACSDRSPEIPERREGVTAHTLLQAIREFRPTVGQLTGTGYASCTTVEDDLLPASRCSPTPAIDRAAANALVSFRWIGRTAASTTADPAAHHHLLGLWELLWRTPVAQHDAAGERKRSAESRFLNRAVDELEAAGALQPDSAEFQSDLAVALIARATQANDPLDLLRAVEATGRAIALDPCLQAAYFNRGIALSALGAATPAAEAFDAYIGLDGCPPSEADPAWAVEAAERRDQLRQPGGLALGDTDKAVLLSAALAGDGQTVDELVGRFGGHVTRWVDARLFRDWAEQALSGTSQGDPAAASELLAAIETIAAALSNLLDDPGPLATVRAIRATEGTPGYQSLASAHSDVASAPLRCSVGETQEALADLAAAVRTLKAADSPFAGLGSVAEALCHYLEDDYARSLQALLPLDSPDPRQDRGRIAARRARVAGLYHYHLGDYASALSAYDRAVELARGAREAHEEARAWNGIGETAEQLGLYWEAWEAHFQAMVLTPWTTDSTSYIAFSGAASLATRTGRLDLAAPLRDQANELGSFSQSPAVHTQAAIQQALFDARTGQLDLARGALEAALAEVPTHLKALVSDLYRALGEVLAASDADQALAAYQQSIEADQETGYRPALVQARLGSARILRAAGDLAGAERELARAERTVAELRQRFAGLGLDDRTEFATMLRDLADEQVALAAIDRADAAAAFHTSERAIADSLNDWLGGGVDRGLSGTDSSGVAPQAVTADEVRNQLAPGTGLVTFRSLPDRLVVWCFDQGDFVAPPPIAVPRPELAKQVVAWTHDLQRVARNDDDAELVRAKDLARFLLAPCDFPRPSHERLVFVPDGPLHGLPFAALADPESERRLLERTNVVIAPSAASHLAAARAMRGLPAGTPPVVAAFGYGAATTTTTELEWVEKEIAQVTAAYGPAGRAAAWIGPAATAANFRDHGPRSEILHVAAHAFGDEQAPSRTRLMLAADAETSGRIDAAEILAIDFRQTRVAVLSACSTADPAAAARGGASTLARAFLVAGVPSVIGSLWRVDDSELTVDLASELHRGLAEGLHPSAALARAQKHLLLSGAPPRVWAVFQLYGTGGEP